MTELLPQDDATVEHRLVIQQRKASELDAWAQQMLTGAPAAPGGRASAPGAAASAEDQPPASLPDGGGEMDAWAREQMRRSGAPATRSPRPAAADERPAAAGEKTASADQRGIVRRVASDVGLGVIEAPWQLAGGAWDAIREMAQTIDDAGDWLNEHVADLRIKLPSSGNKTIDRTVSALVDPISAVAGMPPIAGEAESVTGGLARAAGQFLAPFGALRLGRPATAAGKILEATARGAIVDFSAFDPLDEGLSNLMQSVPELANPVTEFLATDPASSDAENRLKRAVEGVGFGALTDGVFMGIRAIRAARAARKAAQAQVPPSGASASVKGGDDALADAAAAAAERDYLVLGDPARPLVEVRTADAPSVAVSKRVAKSSPADAYGEARVQAERLEAPAMPDQPQVFVNFARINGSDDIRSAIQMLADADVEGIERARRGVQTHQQAKMQAGRINAFETLAARRRGQPLGQKETVAVRQLWAQSADKLVETAQRASIDPSEGNLVAFRRMLETHNAIQEEVLGARAEAARAFDAWKIPVDGSSKSRMRELEAALDGVGGSGVQRDLARRIALVGSDPALAQELDAVVRGTVWTRTRDAMMQAWINGLLSGPKTHLVNIISNSSVVFNQITERAVAARLGRMFGTDAGVEVGEATAQMFGVIEGLKDALRLGTKGNRGGVWQVIAGGESKVMKGAKIDVTNAGRVKPISAKAWGLQPGSNMARAIDLLGTVVDVPGRALAAEDELFKSVGYRMELNARALRQASQEVSAGKLPRAQLQARIAELVEHPPDDIRLASMDQALLQTFTNPLSPKGQAVLKTVNAVWPLRIVFPFVRTPMNIFRYATERSPLAPLVGQWRADIAAGGARADLAISRMALGSAVLLVALDAARSGAITGRAPLQPGDRESWMREKQAYSIKLGDRWFAYNRLDPLGMTLGIAGDLASTFDNADFDAEFDENASRAVAVAAAAIASNVMSKSYMSGMSNLMAAMTMPDAYAEPYVRRLAGTLVPATTLTAEAARAVDPYLRHAASVTDGIMARVPFGSETLPKRHDVWGDEISLESGLGTAWDVLSPVYSKGDRARPVDHALNEVGYHPSLPPKRVHFETRAGSVEANLRTKPEVYERYVQLAGNGVSLFGGPGLADVLDQAVEGKGPLGPAWQVMPDWEREKLVRNLVQEHRTLARRALLQEFPELRAEVDRRADELMRERSR